MFSNANAVPDPRDRLVLGEPRHLESRQRSYLFGWRCRALREGKGQLCPASAIASLPPSSALSLGRHRTGLFGKRLPLQRQNRENVSFCFIAPGRLCLDPPPPGCATGTVTGASRRRRGSVPALRFLPAPPKQLPYCLAGGEVRMSPRLPFLPPPRPGMRWQHFKVRRVCRLTLAGVCPRWVCCGGKKKRKEKALGLGGSGERRSRKNVECALVPSFHS